MRGYRMQDVLVLRLLLLLALDPAALKGTEVTAALEAQGGDEALDFRPARSRECAKQ